jgi:tetratricopeptide (TPR) repeat protein
MSDDPRKKQVTEDWQAFDEHGQRREFAEAEAACRRALATIDAMVADSPGDPDLHYARGTTLGRLAFLCMHTDRRNDEAQYYRQAIPALQAAADGRPGHDEYRSVLAMMCYNLGTLESQLNHLAEAEALLLRAVPIQLAIAEAQPENHGIRYECAQSQFNLGNVYLYSERPEPARACFLAAQAHWRQLHAVHPDHAPLLHDLARCHFNLAYVSPAEAPTHYREALGLWEKLVAQHPDHAAAQYDLARCRFNLCVSLQNDRKFDEALALAEQGTHEFQKLALAFPDVAPYQQSLGQAVQQWNQFAQAVGPPERVLDVHRRSIALMEPVLLRRGDADGLRNMGVNHLQAAAWFSDALRRPDLAQAIYRDAEAFFQKRRAERPDAEADHLLACVYYDWAILLREKLDALERTEELQRRGLRLWEALTATHPDDDRHLHQLASSHNNLGILYLNTARVDRAEACYRSALRVRERILERQPTNLDNQVYLAGTLCNLGNAALARRDGDAARDCYDSSARLLRQVAPMLPADSPTKPLCEQFLQNAEQGLTAAALDMPDPAKQTQHATVSPRPEGPPPRVESSIEAIDAQLRDKPGDRQLRRDKADLLRWHNAPLVALPLLDELLQQDPADAHAWHLRGLVLGDFGGPGGEYQPFDHARQEQALDAFDEAILLDPEYFDARFHKGLTLIRLAHAAQARLRVMADLLKEHGPTVLQPYQVAFQSTVRRAQESLDEAARLRPRDPRVWHELATLFADLFGTRDNPAERYFLKLVECDPNRPDAWYRLAEIADQRGSRGDALDYLKRAIALQPDYRDRAFADFPWITAKKLA